MTDRVIISPGVYDREIDGTVRPASPVGVGAALISQRTKGPAMTPVLVKDKDEDELTFGVPSSTGKDLGAFTARAYLNLRTNPLTQIRVLGMDDTGIQPGFNIGNAGGLFAIGASGSNVLALILASGTVSMVGALTSSVDSLGISIAGYGDVTASLNRSSNRFLEKVLNTDPTQFSNQKHLVYAVFDYANKVPASNNAFFALKVPEANNWQDSFLTSSTTEVISQPFGLTEYGLFGIGSIPAGNSSNSQFKVTILNIKKSTNPSVDEFGTFSLVVRRYDDNDRNPIILESYSGLTLNPNSPNYICRVIGDSYKVWNKGQKKFDEFGEFENKSKFIYIIPSLDLKNGNVPDSALPFGFRGQRSVLSGAFSSKATFPDVPFVSNLLYKNDFNTRVCWGAAVINNASGSLNFGVDDRAQHLPKTLTVASGTTGANFSLKWVSASVSSVSAFSDVTRLTDIQIQTLSSSIAYNTSSLNPAPSGSGGFSGYLSIDNIENTPLAKFTMIVSDGWDGTDLTKANPFDPQDMSTTNTYQTYAYRTAIDMLSNPDEIELKDLVIPGVWANKVTDYAIEMVENRGDMFYMMDISGSTIDDAIDHLTSKNVDTNYASCWYPELYIEDRLNNRQVLVPPTVVMPAVFAYNDSVGGFWYAPAGFNRGGLSVHGVKKAREKLKKSQRDKLQENRINPIATFSSEGVVVWGQLTLQKAASALDRINVRRMLLELRKMIAKEATKIIFEPNVASTWDKFINKVEPKLERLRVNNGIEEFRLILDDSTTTEDLIERNIMYGKIAIKPTRSAEKILLDFFVTNNAAGFED
jgi:hypothetical protein